MTRQEILNEALRITSVDRQATHGRPERNFETIAAFWSTYLSARFGIEIKLESYDVAALNIFQKLSRIVTSPGHADNWTDAVGYSALGGETATEVQGQQASEKVETLRKKIFGEEAPELTPKEAGREGARRFGESLKDIFKDVFKNPGPIGHTEPHPVETGRPV